MVPPLLVTGCVVIGHLGWWLFCYNRINATGLPRKWVKSLEKIYVALCLAIPVEIVWLEGEVIREWVSSGTTFWPQQGLWFRLWGAWCIACFFILGTLWLNSRRSLIPPPALLTERVATHPVERILGSRVTGNRIASLLNCVPGNEITKLSVTEKSLRIERSIPGTDGLRIGHISDLHFTGHLKQAYYRYALDQLSLCSPDLICLTGDTIDHDHCLDWLEELLGPLRAPLGCYFLMGNHEKRLSDWREVPLRLSRLGWHDMGTNEALINLSDQDQPLRIWITGNERPWFDRRNSVSTSHAAQVLDPFTFRLGMSHSPDQYSWARRLRLDLLLAGHTHGGQVRLPGIGPLVAPSWYGSQYASGVFHLPPTVLHVSRGLAGIHPIRWRCLPEISLLTISSALAPGLQQSENKISQLQDRLQRRSHIS